MTGPTLPFPAARTLERWWRQLGPRNPRGLWAAQLLLHRVDALVACRRAQPLDPLDLLVLQARTVTPAASLEHLDKRLYLGKQLLNRLLLTLEAAGQATAAAGRTWHISPAGRDGLDSGTAQRLHPERRVFFFRDSATPGQPPRFLALDPTGVIPFAAGAGWTFAPRLLAEAVGRDDAWKETHGFPREVVRFFTAPPPPLQPWQAVVVDQPLCLPAALMLTEGAVEAFAADPSSWTIGARPAFRMEADWQDVFPELTAQPAQEDCERAWRSWCGERELSIEFRGMRVEGPRLRVAGATADISPDDAWLLAGKGRIRAALRLEVAD